MNDEEKCRVKYEEIQKEPNHHTSDNMTWCMRL